MGSIDIWGSESPFGGECDLGLILQISILVLGFRFSLLAYACFLNTSIVNLSHLTTQISTVGHSIYQDTTEKPFPLAV